MDVLDIMKSRHSVRCYQNKPVEEEKLKAILSAAHMAPTAANLQPVRLLVVQKQESLRKIYHAANIYHAPLAIIVCSDVSKAWVRPFDKKSTADIDAAIVTDHMMLTATSFGLGSVWICYFKADVLKSEFGFPKNLEPINILAIGYADDQPSDPNRFDKERITLDKLISYEHI